jgi:hypothetical protein
LALVRKAVRKLRFLQRKRKEEAELDARNEA